MTAGWRRTAATRKRPGSMKQFLASSTYALRRGCQIALALMFAATGIAYGQGGGRQGGGRGAAQTPPSLEELPVMGIANVTFKVADVDKARDYYKGILGFAEAFDLKDRTG